VAKEEAAEVLSIDGREVRITHPSKVYFSKQVKLTKLELVRYYLSVAEGALAGIRDRPIVLKRFVDGAEGEAFYQKRAPDNTPEWLRTVKLAFPSGRTAQEIVVDDAAGLAWIVNLGCIDLNEWYARCDDVDRPDYLHFDLDPGEEVGFPQVVETAHAVNETLRNLGMSTYPKTTGSRGIHVYVPIVRGPTQKDVWTVSKAISNDLARRHPKLLTAIYRKEARPAGRVLVDYNQNAWGRTLASVYSVRPRPRATVSTPVTWDEVTRGFALDDFRMDNVPARVAKLGDLWASLNAPRGRFDLSR